MRLIVGFLRCCLGMSMLGTISIATSFCPREKIDEPPAAAMPARSPARAQSSAADLFSKLIARHHWQEVRLVHLYEVRTYSVKNASGKMLAEEAVVMQYIAPRTVTFAIRSGEGSRFIRRDVFQRLLSTEKNRVRADKDRDSLITPENYTLEIVGTDRIGSSGCLVVHAAPKRKETDLFDGKIWIDDQDFAIVKITGHLAKSPSFWIKQVDFVRDYQKIDGFWLVSREEVVSNVRIFGKEKLAIDYQDYTVNGVGAVRSLLTNVRHTSVAIRSIQLSYERTVK